MDRINKLNLFVNNVNVLIAGALFGMRSFAPMIGFSLGAWTNSLYVDLTGNFAVFLSFNLIINVAMTLSMRGKGVYITVI